MLVQKGVAALKQHKNSDKENVTTLIYANALGKVGPSLTLFKTGRFPSVVNNMVPNNWTFGKTEKGWMTSEAFYLYMANSFYPFLLKTNIERHVIVFMDGHRLHLTLDLGNFCKEKGIILVAIYPNSTHIIQTLDVGVFGPLKIDWRNMTEQYRFEHNGNEITKFDVPNLLSKLINKENFKSNVVSGFRKSGIYPFDKEAIDYSKILNKPITKNNVIPDETLKKHIEYFESVIPLELLDEFKMTRRRNHPWEGAIEAKLLFETWQQIQNNYETNKSLNAEPIQDADQFTTPENCALRRHPQPLSHIIRKTCYAK